MDEDVMTRIGALVDEEHRLLQHSSSGHPLTDEDHARIAALEVQLDQCWDLLRQRRARRDAGGDAAEVEARPTDVVEGYQQ